MFGQRTQLWWDLPLGDSFELPRHVYRVPAAAHAARLAELVELLEPVVRGALAGSSETPYFVKAVCSGKYLRSTKTGSMVRSCRLASATRPRRLPRQREPSTGT